MALISATHFFLLVSFSHPIAAGKWAPDRYQTPAHAHVLMHISAHTQVQAELQQQQQSLFQDFIESGYVPEELVAGPLTLSCVLDCAPHVRIIASVA